MEFLLVSDLHVDDYAKFSVLDPKTGMNSRLYWCVNIFDQILEYGEKHNVKNLLIGGDIFDKRGAICVQAYDAVYMALLKFLGKDWNIISIVGNHDQAIRSGKVHSLNPLPIEVIQEYGYSSKLKNLGGVSFSDNSSDFLNLLKALKLEGNLEYLLIHQGITGAKIAGDEILSKEDLRVEDIRSIVGEETWIFSGHYHIHQKVDDRFYYIGSSTPKDFGDKTTKGFLHFKDGKLKQIESLAPKFIVMDAKEIYEKKSLIPNNYVKIEYDKEEPKDIADYKPLFYICTKNKVDRDYSTRTSIDPESSPLKIISSYINDLRANKALSDNLDDASLLKNLNKIIGDSTLEQNFGGHKISLYKLEAENFLSYKNLSIDFLDYQGLISIEGSNKDDSSSVSNGAGKSSIPEAIKWCLFGTTSRGISGDSVVNNSAKKDCHVSVILGIDDKYVVSIERYRKHTKYKNEIFFYKYDEGMKPSDFRGSKDSVTQEKIIKDLGIDEKTFDNTVFFGHNFTSSFAALTDKEQKQVLENILGIEYLSNLHDQAKSYCERTVDSIRGLESKLTYLKTRLKDEYLNQESLHQSFNLFEKNRINKIQNQKQIIEIENSKLKDLENVDELTTQLNVLKTSLETGSIEEKEFSELKGQEIKIVEEQIKITNRDTKLNRLLSESKSRMSRSSQEYEIIETQINNIRSSIESKKCYTCNQLLPSSDGLENEIKILENKLQSYSDIMKEEETNFAYINKQIDENRTQYNLEQENLDEIRKRALQLSEVIEILTQLKADRDQLERKIENYYRIKNSINSTIEVSNNLIKNYEQEVNPILSQSERTISKIKEFEDEGESISKQIKDLNFEFEIYKFWETAFSDKGTPNQSPIKSYIFDSVVPVLDELSRVYSDKLTNGTLEVRFNTVKQLRTGEYRDKFNVEVDNSFGSKEYLGDSGGERRKVDLTIMFALHSLARIRSGSQMDVLFLDEILDSLDSEGCSRVMDLLKDMTTEINKIFVITHNENLKTRFCQRLIVNKSNGVSSKG